MRIPDNCPDLAKAFVAAQAEIIPATKDSENPYYHSHYADLAAIVAVIRQPFARHKLAFSQDAPTRLEDGATIVTVTTTIIHESGQQATSEPVQMMAMHQEKGTGWQPSNDPHSIASVTMYARRNSLQTTVGVAAEDDDDGNAASGRDDRARETRPPTKAKVGNGTETPPNAPSRFDKLDGQLALMAGDLIRLTKTEPWLLSQTKFSLDEHRRLIIHLYELLITVEGANKSDGQLTRLNDLGKRIINAQPKRFTEDDLGELLHKLQPFIDLTIKEAAPTAA